MKDKNFIWWFDPKIYPPDIIVSASQSFVDKAYVMIDGNPDEQMAVQMRAKDKSTDLHDLKKAFDLKLKDELQAVGIQISPNIVKEEIKGVVEDGVKVEPSYLDDPYGIAVPYEKRFGKKSQKKR